MFKIDPTKISEKQSADERTWRNEELVRADRCLNKVQDGASSVGTVSDWRKYRNELRDWPDHESFPNKVFRPVAPDA